MSLKGRSCSIRWGRLGMSAAVIGPRGSAGFRSLDPPELQADRGGLIGGLPRRTLQKRRLEAPSWPAVIACQPVVRSGA